MCTLPTQWIRETLFGYFSDGMRSINQDKNKCRASPIFAIVSRNFVLTKCIISRNINAPSSNFVLSKIQELYFPGRLMYITTNDVKGVGASIGRISKQAGSSNHENRKTPVLGHNSFDWFLKVLRHEKNLHFLWFRDTLLKTFIEIAVVVDFCRFQKSFLDPDTENVSESRRPLESGSATLQSEVGTFILSL